MGQSFQSGKNYLQSYQLGRTGLRFWLIVWLQLKVTISYYKSNHGITKQITVNKQFIIFSGYADLKVNQQNLHFHWFQIQKFTNRFQKYLNFTSLLRKKKDTNLFPQLFNSDKYLSGFKKRYFGSVLHVIFLFSCHSSMRVWFSSVVFKFFGIYISMEKKWLRTNNIRG